MLGALPGSGWDNLRNVEQSGVFTMNYSLCHFTEDGVLLVPDDVQVFPVKNSKASLASTIIEHMHDYKSVDSTSINMKISLSAFFASIQGSFSTEYLQTKQRTSKEKTTVSRSELKYHLYTAITKPSITLDPAFNARLMDIAYNLQENENATARYNAQRLVADYGTHFINRVYIGASLVQEDLVRSEYVKEMNEKRLDIGARAGASFLSMFKLDLSAQYNHSTKDIDEYRKNCMETKVVTYGGPAYRQNFSINNWIDHLDNNLVVIDRDGDLLSALVSPERLPGMPMAIVQRTSYAVQKAIEAYYEYNTYPGCTDATSKNFDVAANADDSSCVQPSNNYTFGGIYQTCSGSCTGKPKINPQTGELSCPPGYQSQLLQKVHVPISIKKCKSRFWRKKKCWIDKSQSYDYEIYWCAAREAVDRDSGYLFGGTYTSNTENIVTGEQSCPEKYKSIIVGGSEKIAVCLSDDYELAARSSLPFAGFFSCAQGNPLSRSTLNRVRSLANGLHTLASYEVKMKTFDKKCPEGFSPHLLTINAGCAIHYCTKSNSKAHLNGKLPMIRRPPFGYDPLVYQSPDPVKVLYSDDTDAVWVKKPMDDVWSISTASQLTELKQEYDESEKVQAAEGSEHENSTTVIGLSVVIGALGCLVIVLSVTLYKKRRNGYEFIQRPLLEEEGNETYGACEEDGSLSEVCQD